MTDDQLDPRFERAVRATLAELDPGNPPAALQHRGDRCAGTIRPPGAVALQPSMALGGLAAALLVAVVGIGVLTRFSATVAPQPSVAPAPGVRVELVSDDPLAPLADIVRILDARLDAADLDDSTIAIEGGRIVVDAPVDPARRDRRGGADPTAHVRGRGRGSGHGAGRDRAGSGPCPGTRTPCCSTSEDVVRRRGRRRRLGPGGRPADTWTRLRRIGSPSTRSANVGEMFAIAVDGEAIVAPMINEPITDGDIQITVGPLDASGADHLREMVAMLEGGPLPAPLRVVADEPSDRSVAHRRRRRRRLRPRRRPRANDHAGRSRQPPVRVQPVPFPASLLDERRFDERADTPEAEALRAHLAMDGPDYDRLPDDGWALVGCDDARPSTWPGARRDGGLMSACCHNDGGWRVDGWGPCQPRMVRDDGIGPPGGGSRRVRTSAPTP